MSLTIPYPEKCEVDHCEYNAYKQGLCYQHYHEQQEPDPDYLHERSRDRELERKDNERG